MTTAQRQDLLSMKAYHKNSLMMIDKMLQEEKAEGGTSAAPRGSKPLDKTEISQKLEKQLLKRIKKEK